MANLKAFTVNAQAVESGRWIKPGEEYDDLEILTRGYTDAYEDAKAAKLRRLALPFNGDVQKVPSAARRAAVCEALIAHCLMDVRGLVDGSGQPISFAAFCDLLREPAYSPLLTAAFQAASQVGNTDAVELAEAAGN